MYWMKVLNNVVLFTFTTFTSFVLYIDVYDNVESNFYIPFQVQTTFVFLPPDDAWRQQKIAQLHLPIRQTMSTTNEHPATQLTMPSLFREIIPDGNCYFRCISFAVTGSEEYYNNIRQSICEYIRSNPDTIQEYLPENVQGNVELYLQTSRMELNSTWASEVEIFATAFLLQTNIYIYTKSGVHWTWLRHSPTGNVSNKSIYLYHRNQNHYDVVLCVLNANQMHCTSGNIYSITHIEELDAQRRRDQHKTINKERYKSEKTEPDYQSTSYKEVPPNAKQHQSSKKNQETKNASNYTYAKRKQLDNRRRYWQSNQYRLKKKLEAIHRYAMNSVLRAKIKRMAKLRYSTDPKFKQNLLDKSFVKYWLDKSHRQRKLFESIHKYKTDVVHKEMAKSRSKRKYAQNKQFQQTVKNTSKMKYDTNAIFRNRVKTSLKQKYQGDTTVQDNKKKRVYSARQSVQRSIQTFFKRIQSVPVYVCTVCIRMLYKNQVKKCVRTKYSADIVEQCLTGMFVEQSQQNKGDQSISKERQTEWICYNCHSYLSKEQMPPQAFANNMMLEEIPEVLRKLNVLERQLVAMRIPFMKLLSLPRGGQKGVKGPVVNVPTDLTSVTTSLPRNIHDAQLIKVKLKRKLSYKGHYSYQWINPSNVIDAMMFLKESNKWYSDVRIDKEWVHGIQNSELVQKTKAAENEDYSDSQFSMDTDVDHDDQTYYKMDTEVEDSDGTTDNPYAMETDTENAHDPHQSMDSKDNGSSDEDARTENNDVEEESNIPVETCFQPVDIGQDYLDTNRTLCLAPSENQNPQNIFKESGADAMAFPTLLPDGNFGLSHDRSIKLSPAKYFNARLFSADPRFATNKDFIFFAQYVTELNYISSNISLALRKGQAVTEDGKKVTASMLTQSDNLSNILKSDIGYRFLQPVRGTPPYWQRTLKDLYAMIRQLGIPTWFVTFSAAEMRWEEVISTLLAFTNDDRSIDELEASDKLSLVIDNPVMCARMYDHRVKALFTDLILSKAAPVGRVIDFFYRTEFQQRGSPHIHCLFWVEGAPKLDEDSDQDVCNFIDKYVTCTMPDKDEDPELFDIVSSVQVHNRNHSKSCRKYNTTCRFNFPRPPVEKTFVARVDKEEIDLSSEATKELSLEEFNELTKKASRNPKKILRHIWELVSSADESNLSFQDILRITEISYEEYTQFLTDIVTRNTIHVKREMSDVWVNNYNATLSLAWNANLDIQYVTDAYACVAYILSYISKAETEMGDLLQNAKKEADDGNVDAVTAMRQIGNVYLQNREVSAQEAVYRVCGLHLKQSSRNVVFVPAGRNITKMSLPINLIKSRSRSADDENIWMTSIHEKYYSRPDLPEFENICLAEFCSKYRILTASQKPKQSKKKTLPVYELKNELGFIRQCKPGKEAVVRYPRFNPAKNTDDFYLSLVQLFLPHRLHVVLPEDVTNFEQYVRSTLLNDRPILEIIDENRSNFEINAEGLEKAWQDLQEGQIHENAWGNLAPQSEVERSEIEMDKIPQDIPEEVEEIPELSIPHASKSGPYSIDYKNPLISQKKLKDDLRSMNAKQSQIFYKIRNWCRQVFWGKSPDPFHLFVTGGAGTGKSHLIRCIYHEATRILKCIESPDSLSVLLTAPTGTAAFNIEGVTIHTAFSISTTITLPYQPLKEETLNTLRTRLGNLQLLIIDEISMVNHKVLTYIHGRLCQLKHNKKPFGDVSVLAVGDFFQLPPVSGTPLYKPKESDFFDLWKDHFSVATLEEVMRQKEDGEFAAMLNRLRTHLRGTELLPKDEELLQKVCHDETPHDAIDVLHIFARNKEVNKHNNMLIALKCDPIVTSMARDYYRDQATGKLEQREQPYVQCASDDLQTSIKLGINARVMLTRNIDTNDGLVNGAFGTITAIDLDSSNCVKAVYVKFDNEKVGRKHMQKTSTIDPQKKSSVKIEPVDDSLRGKKATRRQLPLKLGYSATIHKTQGMTANEIVVSMNDIFQPGMAYVALSRATSLKGLHILDFNPDVIYSSQDITDALENMPSFLSPVSEFAFHKGLTIWHHNTEGLLPHLPDIKKMVKDDIVCFTETWFDEQMTLPASLLPGYTPVLLSRKDAYTDDQPLFNKLSSSNRGGVGILTQPTITQDRFVFSVRCMEAVAIVIKEPFDFVLSTVYRPPSYPLHQFMIKIGGMLNELEQLGIPSIIVGDFNDNALQQGSCKVVNGFSEYGYTQLVSQPTTESGSCLDLVFVKGINLDKIQVELHPTYYSFHDAIRIHIDISE